MMNNQINNTPTNKTKTRGAFKQPILTLLKNPKLTHKEIAAQVGCTLDLVRYYCRSKVKNKSLSLPLKLKRLNATEEALNKNSQRDPQTLNYVCKISGDPIDLNADKWALRLDKKTRAPFIFLLKYSALLSYSEKTLINWAKNVLTERGYKIEEPKCN
jgi:hypothetical protein